ncbi:uncharacterized protein LOC34622175 [Cyclospora cayetanensis]|uniref:Uncharacterized protein LOC34622175 n=1 Tax=Cyclospora cayetanensis TaxID=88456 RepID=A0A6P6RQD3_9EIME|nr:uncharacterized protein LOC34622175 [Cyclospora cayetanensis]
MEAELAAAREETVRLKREKAATEAQVSQLEQQLRFCSTEKLEAARILESAWRQAEAVAAEDGTCNSNTHKKSCNNKNSENSSNNEGHHQELHASFEGGNDGSSFCAGSVQQHALRVTRAVSQLESLVAKLRRHLHESQALSEEHLHQLKQMKQQLKEQQMLLEQREQALTQEKDISSRLRRQCNAATAKTKQLTAASKELQRAAIDLSLKRCSPQKIWERAGATKAPATAPVGAASKSRDAATVAQSTASMHLPGLLNSSGAAQVAAAIASEATRLFTAAQKEMTQGLQQQPIQEGPENDAKQATDTNHPLPQSHWRCSAALSSSFESSLYASRSGWSAAKPSAAGAAVLQPADLRGGRTANAAAPIAPSPESAAAAASAKTARVARDATSKAACWAAKSEPPRRSGLLAPTAAPRGPLWKSSHGARAATAVVAAAAIEAAEPLALDEPSDTPLTRPQTRYGHRAAAAKGSSSGAAEYCASPAARYTVKRLLQCGRRARGRSPQSSTTGSPNVSALPASPSAAYHSVSATEARQRTLQTRKLGRAPAADAAAAPGRSKTHLSLARSPVARCPRAPALKCRKGTATVSPWRERRSWALAAAVENLILVKLEALHPNFLKMIAEDQNVPSASSEDSSSAPADPIKARNRKL